ncbi:hypothetical protein [Natronosalvus amylolyticus]|uniref:hypothetical protein n=1 Tax=Natronosalvus amylolyticus TaxID=2961994 RepID=UPI0020C96AC5|nr:hypothetical protein [Natronosalvus amylolyticus]
MKRREVLFGVAGLTATGILAAGSGAFSATSVERTVSVSLAEQDSDALLTLEATSDLAEIGDNDGSLLITIDEELGTESATGINANATYVFSDVFTIQNLGTQTVEVKGEAGKLTEPDETTGQADVEPPDDEEPEITLWTEDGGSGDALNEELDPGEDPVSVSVKVDTTNVDTDGDLVDASYVIVAETSD